MHISSIHTYIIVGSDDVLKKVTTIILSLSVLISLILFCTPKAVSANDAMFILYPLTTNLTIAEDQVNLGIAFGDKANNGIHKGLDIMASCKKPVYPYKDSDAYVKLNWTNASKYTNEYDKYWNSFLIVYYPNLELYVYYGHIVSSLSDNQKIDANEPLGYIRESYGYDKNGQIIRTPNNDHLHLGVNKDFVDGKNEKWGYATSATTIETLESHGWVNPIDFMRGQTSKTNTTQTVLATPTNSVIGIGTNTVNTEVYTINQANYFKLRDIAALLNYTKKQFAIAWDGIKITLKLGVVYAAEGNELTISNNYTSQSATPSIAKVYLDNQQLNISAYTIRENNYFKLRDIAATINFGLSYDEGSGKVTIDPLSDYSPTAAPTLLSPSNGSTSKKSSPTLYWNSVNSPSGGQVKYWAETYDCPYKENSGWITGTSWTPTSTKSGLYNWHVKSIDVSTGKESSWGTTWQYTIDAEYQPPNMPNPLSPSNGFTVKGGAPTLYWSSVSSPSGGLIQYCVETFDCPTPQISGWITGTSWTPSTTATGLYNWHVKSRDYTSGKESGWGAVWQFNIAAEYQPPNMPNPTSPSNGSTFQSGAPTLYWSSVSSPSGGQIQYWVETFDCPNPQNSGWISGTSWTPPTNNLGLYNWHVKSRDLTTVKESGWGAVWQFTLAQNTNSTDLHLDIRVAKFGPYDAQNTYSDQTSKVRDMISNDSVTIQAADSFFFPAGDPGPSYTKTLIIIYRNRWNEEWQITCSEGQSITLTRDSRVGTFLLDADG
jgi:hypothetical protein